MKKNLISLAVAASVVGVSMAAQSQGMFINPEGKGEVLVFPFYDGENGNATNFHIVNTTDDVKAVKVRFLEYKNSQEVLDFNLYLSREDHFAFGVIMDPNGTGGAIITHDNSCTVPELGTNNPPFNGTKTENADGSITRIQPFTNFDFVNKGDVDQDPARTLRGHVEVIEMGVVANAAYIADATHGADGVPSDCADLREAWATRAWAVADVDMPEGGLYGLSYHINIEDAAAYGIEPAAVHDWHDGTVATYHSDPGNFFPSIVDGRPASHVPEGGVYVPFSWVTGRDAVTSLFMSKTIENDVALNPVVGGMTDWAITFPTKRYYVDPYEIAPSDPIAPFSDYYFVNAALWGVTAAPTELRSCEVVRTETWDREEAFVAPDNNFSPRPDEEAAVICDEQWTGAWGGAGTPSALGVERDLFNSGFNFTEGWARLSFNNIGVPAGEPNVPGQADQVLCDDNNDCLRGLPMQGFAAFRYANGSMGGTLMNYGHVADHKTNVVISLD